MSSAERRHVNGKEVHKGKLSGRIVVYEYVYTLVC